MFLKKRNDILVSLDFDGVVADTIPALYSAYIDFLQEYGVSGTIEEFEACNGLNIFQIVQLLVDAHGIRGNEKDLVTYYKNLMTEHIRESKPMRGILELLVMLSESNVPIVITSSAPKIYIEAFLTKNALLGYFTDIISGDEVEHAKPDSAIYLKLRQVYSDYRIFAVEDSINGIVSSFNSGVNTILYDSCRKYTTSSLPCHIIVNELENIPKAVREIYYNGYFIRYDRIKIELVDCSFHFSRKEQDDIDNTWEKRPSAVYDGKVVALKSYTFLETEGIVLKGYITSYKNVWYSKMTKKYKEAFTAIAVSAVAIDRNGDVIIAERNRVTDDAGYKELVPSGGIEENNIMDNLYGYREQIIQELCEETGGRFSADDFNIFNMGICFDEKNNNIDICLILEYMEVWDIETLNCVEYKKGTLKIVPIEEASTYLEGKGVYTSRMILCKLNDVYS